MLEFFFSDAMLIQGVLVLLDTFPGLSPLGRRLVQRLQVQSPLQVPAIARSSEKASPRPQH
jgi:hypothetical protein